MLNVVAWGVFLMLFGCVRQNINDSSEKLKLIYIKNFLSYAIKTSKLKNIEKSVEETVQALKPCENGLGMC